MAKIMKKRLIGRKHNLEVTREENSYCKNNAKLAYTDGT